MNEFPQEAPTATVLGQFEYPSDLQCKKAFLMFVRLSEFPYKTRIRPQGLSEEILDFFKGMYQS